MTTVADSFDQMAARLRHNAESGFGGAWVIALPPQADGQASQVIETLILDTPSDLAQTLMLLQAKITYMLEEVQKRERAGAYGR